MLQLQLAVDWDQGRLSDGSTEKMVRPSLPLSESTAAWNAAESSVTEKTERVFSVASVLSVGSCHGWLQQA
jgi:hypothetical protein